MRMCMHNVLGLESFPTGRLGKHVRRFPAATLQNPNPQSQSSALISSYRHGACGQRLPGSQTLGSATVTGGVWKSEPQEEEEEADLLAHFLKKKEKDFDS